MCTTTETTLFSPRTLFVICESEPAVFDSGVYVCCVNCFYVCKVCQNVKCIVIYRNECDSCMLRPQSLLSESSLEDIGGRIDHVRKWLYDGLHHGKSFLGHYLNIPTFIEPHLNLIEDVLLLGNSFIQSRNTFDRYIAIVNFCKLRGSRLGFVSTLLYISSDLFGSQFTKDPLQNEVSERLKFSPQSDDNMFAELRSKLGVYEKMKETTMYKKLHKFLLYILTIGILDGVNVSFDSLKFSEYDQKCISRTHQPGADMLFCMLDTVLFVCEKGSAYFKTGDTSVFFHSGSSYEKWLTSSGKLIRDSKFLNNPEPHKINKFAFLSDLKDNIEKGSAIVRFTAGLEKTEKLYIQKILNDLKMIEAEEITRKSSQQPRKDPFAVLLHGSSSIGKSQLKQILFYHYGKVFGHPTTSEFMYTRCPTDEYWSGFNSTQWCIVMDDIAFLKPNNEVDPTLKEMLQVKNSVPYTPPQAALEDKGRTPIKAELLIGTTNTKNLNLHAYFACPFAIARRMSYIITPHVKQEYSKNGFMLDPSSVPPTPEGEYMDIWTFDVSVPVPATNEEKDMQGTKYVIKHTFDNIYDMLDWYISVAREHELHQGKAMAADSTMMAVELCYLCSRPRFKCKCDSSSESGSDSSSEVTIPEIEPYIEPTTRYMTPEEYSQMSDEQRAAFDYELQDMEEETSLALDQYDDVTKFKLWFTHKIVLGCENDPLSSCEDINAYLCKYKNVLLFIFFVGCYFNLFYLFTFLLVLFSYCIFYFIHRYIFVILRFTARYHYGSIWRYRLLFRICGNESETYRILMRAAGDRVYRMYFSTRTTRMLASFVAAPIVLLTLRKSWLAFQSTFVSEQSNEGVVPVPHDVEKPTFYYQDPYKSVEVDISGASRNIVDDVLYKRVVANTARFELRFDDRETVVTTTGLNIRGNLWLFNKHAYKYSSGYISVIRDPTHLNVSRNTHRIRFTGADVRCATSRDLAIIELKAVTCGKDLVKYFPLDQPLKGSYVGKYIHVSKAGDMHERIISCIKLTKCPWFGVPAYSGRVNTPTDQGDCGSAAIAYVGNAQVIMGIHACGDQHDRVILHHVSQDDILGLIQPFGVQVSEGAHPISAPGYERILVDLHHKSTVRFLERGTAQVMGSFTGYRPKQKSKVCDTFIKDFVVKRGYLAEYGPPDMSWKPWHIAIKDMTNPCFNFDNSVVRECGLSFTQDILSALGDKIFQLEVYTQDVALNGVDGVTYIDRINCSTSAGNPFKKSKKNLMTIDPDTQKITCVDSCIQERIDDIHACYGQGVRYHPQFCGHLKDEPVSRKKQISGKTRVFTGGEFAWSVVVRQFLLSHIRLIQNNPFVFEAMPGVVAQSTEWECLYKYLIKFGKDRMVAGDYQTFDKRMAAPFILEAFLILIRMAEAANWNEVDILYLHCIAHDTAFANIDFNGEYIEIQGNPSGHPLTVIINCLVNSLYMRYAFKCVSHKPLSTFKSLVALATYGDDNIMSVSVNCSEFNHTSIQLALAKIGVVYTMAEKTAASIPYIDICETSFLKRRFVYDGNIGAIVAPLDESSFNKMLTSRVFDKDVCAQAHAVSVIETAMHEYLFYGKDVFEEKRKMFMEIVDEAGLHAWVKSSTFPIYEHLVYEFWIKFGDEDNALSRGIAPRKCTVEENTLTVPRDNYKPQCGIIPHTVVTKIGQNIEGCESRERFERRSHKRDCVADPVSDKQVLMVENENTIFFLQSGEEGLGSSEGTVIAEETTATMSFLEKPAGYKTGFYAQLPAESYADATPDVSLNEYFRRPVRIHTFTWNEADVVGATTTISPWQLFFNNTNIKNKLLNYAWLKCDLKIKVMVNASPFYYGAQLAAYQPLPAFHDGGISIDGANRWIIPYSQRPHIWIYPQNNEGGEMSFPFIWPANWISTINNQEFLDLGTLDFINVSPLNSANGVTGVGVTVSIYAWAENVVVSGPTSGLLLQSDEYVEGPVSKMASAVAATMKNLTKVPLIGKYATATELGAKAVATVASNLGFSNPPVIADVMPFKPTFMPPLASTEVSYPIEKLTLDPKNELSVDPSIIGLPAIDELSVQHLISRESYLTSFSWSTATAADAMLFNTAVSPVMFDIDSSVNSKLYLTPMGWVSQMFQFWRGDVIFRFRFICSQYHRGRVRITFDPSANATQNVLNTVATQTTCFNEIVDLTKDTNIEVRVPYNQALAWCKTFIPTSSSQIPYTNGSSTTFNHVPGTTNGILVMRCVTQLTAPVATSTVQCIVSVRGAENLEFASPADLSNKFSYFAPQSDEYEETSSTMFVAGNSSATLAPGRYLVNHGEQIVSLRQMLRRYCYTRSTLATLSTSSANVRYLIENFHRFPVSPGFDPTGIHLGKGLITPAVNYACNITAMTYLNWVTPAYLGMRGSVNYTINVDSVNPIKTMYVARTTRTPVGGYSTSINSFIPTTSAQLCSNFIQVLGFDNTGSGGVINNQLTNSTLAVQLPNYSAYKMNCTTPQNATSTQGVDDTSLQMNRFVMLCDKNPSAATGQASCIMYYVAAGTDFSVYFFLNVPTVFVYSGFIVPV